MLPVFTIVNNCEPTPLIQAMEEIHKLRGQISNIAQANFSDVDVGFLPKIDPPNAFQVRLSTSCDFERPRLILILSSSRLKFSASF